MSAASSPTSADNHRHFDAHHPPTRTRSRSNSSTEQHHPHQPAANASHDEVLSPVFAVESAAHFIHEKIDQVLHPKGSKPLLKIRFDWNSLQSLVYAGHEHKPAQANVVQRPRRQSGEGGASKRGDDDLPFYGVPVLWLPRPVSTNGHMNHNATWWISCAWWINMYKEEYDPS